MGQPLAVWLHGVPWEERYDQTSRASPPATVLRFLGGRSGRTVKHKSHDLGLSSSNTEKHRVFIGLFVIL